MGEVDSDKEDKKKGRMSPTGKKEVIMIEAKNVTVNKKRESISPMKVRKNSENQSMYGGSRRSNYSGFTNKPLPFNALRFLA